MTTPGKAPTSGEAGPETERDPDRDTLEFDASTLSRLRELDSDSNIADRDTVEISAAEALSLARKSDRSAPNASGEIPVASADLDAESAGDSDAPPTDEVVMVEPAKSKRTLSEIDGESDRSSMLTIPSPPAFEEEP